MLLAPYGMEGSRPDDGSSCLTFLQAAVQRKSVFMCKYVRMYMYMNMYMYIYIYVNMI